jgi:acetyl esterase/lipase
MRAETKPPGGFDISPEIPAALDSMAISRTLCGSASEKSVKFTGYADRARGIAGRNVAIHGEWIRLRFRVAIRGTLRQNHTLSRQFNRSHYHQESDSVTRFIMKFLLFVFAVSLYAADPAGIAIWPNDFNADREGIEVGPKDSIRRVHDVTNPTITPFLPPKDRANGTAVLIFPGGGWRILAIDKEGNDVARWLNTIGVAGFVVKYRVMPTGKNTPADRTEYKDLGVKDCLEAIRIVRSRASEFGIDPKKVGVVGFSAGGYHAARTAINFSAGNRPDFAACIYPAVPESLEFPANSPPLFLVAADDDKLTPSANSVPIYLAAKKSAVPAEMHIFAKGGHGFGMAKSGAATDTWTERFRDWMAGLGLLTR